MCKHYFLIINFCLYLCLILIGCSKTDNSSSSSNSSNTKTCDTYKSENYTCFEKLDPKGLPEYYLIPICVLLVVVVAVMVWMAMTATTIDAAFIFPHRRRAQPCCLIMRPAAAKQKNMPLSEIGPTMAELKHDLAKTFGSSGSVLATNFDNTIDIQYVINFCRSRW